VQANDVCENFLVDVVHSSLREQTKFNFEDKCVPNFNLGTRGKISGGN